MTQLIKNQPVMQETWVQSLGWEDPLEKGKVTHSSILGLENSMDCTVSPWGRKESDTTERLYFHFTAAAKSLQSCLTLWDPIDGSPPGSPIPGILQARTLEWGAIAFSGDQISKILFMWRYCWRCFKKKKKISLLRKCNFSPLGDYYENENSVTPQEYL